MEAGRERTLSHVDAAGMVRMVDVTGKPEVRREAAARGHIRLGLETREQIARQGMAKGNVLATARIAGIQAAKDTARLIPLCHTLPLTHVDLEFCEREDGLEITARVRTRAATGVEMEALTAVSVAALTIYDMCKAIDSAMEISGIRLLEKKKAAE
ncbi:MAG TPA: cyclic pyranopterin monophosphate synthase MoaC [Verrucomicrobiales bacterium]|nr:cyclic pyranopterin monophosphate synthase MoaC [Verrucomicrobiales bacterium]